MFYNHQSNHLFRNTTDASSIGFAVPDSCADESILAGEMITEAKRQLEINQSELKISFVLLSEQKTSYEQLSNYLETTYFDWITTSKIQKKNSSRKFFLFSH